MRESERSEIMAKYTTVLKYAKNFYFMFSVKEKRNSIIICRKSDLATEWHIWGWWHGVTKLLSRSLDASKNASDKLRISKQEDCLNSHSGSQQLQLCSPNIFSLFRVERAERARANSWALLMESYNWILYRLSELYKCIILKTLFLPWS